MNRGGYWWLAGIAAVGLGLWWWLRKPTPSASAYTTPPNTLPGYAPGGHTGLNPGDFSAETLSALDLLADIAGRAAANDQPNILARANAIRAEIGQTGIISQAQATEINDVLVPAVTTSTHT